MFLAQMDITNLVSAHLGELAALTAATLWAAAAIMYQRIGQSISPLMLNLFKGAIAVAILAVGMTATGLITEQVSTRALWLMALSGAVGIGVSDTLFFQALNCLGTRRTLLITTLAPPMAAMLAWMFLGERMGVLAWIGMVVILAGVAWVISERSSDGVIAPHHEWRGLILAFLSALTQAIAAVISKEVFNSETMSPLYSVLIRLAACVLFLLVIIPLLYRMHAPMRGPNAWGDNLRAAKRVWWILLAATCLGAVMGIWLQQIALKKVTPGVAQTLLSTTPILVLPMVALLGEKLSKRAVLGAAAAMAGVVMLFWR